MFIGSYSHSLVLPTEPEEEQAVAEQEQQQPADSLDERHESMQIEEVSQQTAPPAQQGKQDTAGSGVVQSVMGAAKSLFGGGKSDEQVCCFYHSHSPVGCRAGTLFMVARKMSLSDIACAQQIC